MLAKRWKFPQSPTPRRLFYTKLGPENTNASILANRSDLALIAHALNNMGAPANSMGVIIRLAVGRKKKVGASREGPTFVSTTHVFRGETWTCLRAETEDAGQLKGLLISKDAQEKYGDMHIAVAFSTRQCFAERAEPGSAGRAAPVARFVDLADYAYEGPPGEAWAVACRSEAVRAHMWFESPKCTRLERALVPIWIVPMLLHVWGRYDALNQMCTQIDAQLLLRACVFPQYADAMDIYRERPKPVVPYWVLRRHLNKRRKVYNKKIHK